MPTRLFSKPSAQTISVADGSRETIFNDEFSDIDHSEGEFSPDVKRLAFEAAADEV